MKPDPVVEELKSLLQDQPANPMRPNQLQGWQAELERLEHQAGLPADIAGTGKGFARRRYQQVKRMVDQHSAKKITDEPRRTKVYRLTQQVLTEILMPRMLTEAQSRRNPPGAVGHQLRDGEFSKPFKQAALTWKRGMRALDPENIDPDFTNYALYQRTGDRPDGTSSFMADAQIPGHLAMSTLAKARWPLGEPTVDTPLKQAIRQEAEESERTKPKRPATAKQLAALAKAAAARKAKREAAEGISA